MKTSNKIWSKESFGDLDSLIEEYTVGNDYLLDQELLPYDVQASIAHANMLASIGILNTEERDQAVIGLDEIKMLAEAGNFPIERGDEDCHTAIENYLTEKYGDVGKKIHTGRSRNDQVLVAIRLYMKERHEEMIGKVQALSQAFYRKAEKNKDAVMPGYTHMQRAMPSTAGMWLGSFAAALEDDLTLMKATASILDQNPLGSVVAYGETTLGLDREMTTQELRFMKTQENPMYAALSRGKFEALALESLWSVMFTIGKFATDLMLFTTKEFGFVSLPAAFTTGSSAMPQKRNYDVAELMRATTSAYSARVLSLKNIIDKLPSGYNRDFQLAKEPMMHGYKTVFDTVSIATHVVENLVMNTHAMQAACTPELYATEEAYKMVKEGSAPFREAYRIVAEKYAK